MTESERLKTMHQEFDKRAKTILNNPKYGYTYWDKNSVKEAIKKLEEQKLTEESFDNSLSHYKVNEMNGEKVLLNKKTSSIIIPIEDYFDVLHKAHLATDHGSRYTIRMYLMNAKKNERVYIPNLVIGIFSKICYDCQISKFNRRQSVSVNGRNFKRGLVNIIDMSLDPDGEYRYILHYKDCQTLFSHLRPLKDDETVTVFNELLKIFYNLGSPAILYSPLGRKFVQSIVRLFEKEVIRHKIIIGKEINEDSEASDIAEKVMCWMMKNRSSNWAKGVHFIQFDMNTAIGENNLIPYKEMFGVLPKLGIDVTGMPEDLVKSLTEQKLILWREIQQKSKKHKEKKTGCSALRKTTVTKIKMEDGEKSLVDKVIPSTSLEKENVLCWVCDEGDELATEICIQCNALIHIKCGVFNSDSKKITCIICMDDTPLEDTNTEEEKEFKIDIKEEPLIRGSSSEITEPKLNIKEEPMEE